jgi:hypothetical protein
LARVLPYLKNEIVKRSDQAKGFVDLPKRWLVARTFAWVNRCRRLAKDWETSLYEVTGQTLSEGKMSYEPDSKDNYRASDSLTTGVASLLDANMNEAATKLAALQVQQQLGVQALSISNSNARVILKLIEI